MSCTTGYGSWGDGGFASAVGRGGMTMENDIEYVGRLDGDDLLRTASVTWVREAEKASGELLTSGTLMQRAAAAVARVVADEVRRLRADRVVVLVGPGNNGGDALFAARDLARDFGVRADVVLVAGRAHEEGLAAVRDAGLDVIEHPQGPHSECGGEHCDGPRSLQTITAADLVVDGILGIGARASRGSSGSHGEDDSDAAPWASAVRAIGRETHVVAVDCPTPGITADRTVTFGALKTSMLLDPRAAGEVGVVDIGLAELDGLSTDALRWSVQQYAGRWPIPGPHDHKYTRGVVGMATGSNAFPGAAVLGTVAAATAGAGMVRYVGPSRPSDLVLAAVPEAVHGMGRVQAWVVGSGIDGVSEREKNSERYESAIEVLGEAVPVVIDAGALTWLDEIERPEGSVTVITPHAGELASALALLGITDDGDEVTREAVEADPVRWARRMADGTGYVVLLKGGATVIARPAQRSADGITHDRAVFVENRSPNWLATAGTGDVLAGIVGVAIAAGIEASAACTVAAYIHGRAAHLANPGGPVRALDVASNVGRAIAELVEIKTRFDDDLHAGRL